LHRVLATNVLNWIAASLFALGMFAPAARADALTDVPEVLAEGYQLVYRDALPQTFGGGAFSYDVDNSATTPATFDRVAYYLELQSSVVGSPRQFMYVSFNKLAGMTAANKLGVPTLTTGSIFQQALSSMNVVSNVSGITQGTGLSTGWIEFWPSNYNAMNSQSVANASATAYDFGDNRTTGNYGSMQLHNIDVDGTGPGTTGQVLFAYNRWGGIGGNSDLGIGNRPSSADIDWTFAANANTYTIRNLEVLVRPVPEPATWAALMLAGATLFFWRRKLV
jgi:sialate O-acetylesterase